MEDVGSGLLRRRLPAHRGSGSKVLSDGADLVTFSGDKLSGAHRPASRGTPDLRARLASDPMMRALRPCKLILSALERCLLEHLAEAGSQASRLWTLDGSVLRLRAEALLERLRTEAPEAIRALAPLVVETEQPVGGGSIPGLALSGAGLALESTLSAHATLAALREAPVPIVGRILDDRVVLDMRCILEGEDPYVVEGLRMLADRLGAQLPDA